MERLWLIKAGGFQVYTYVKAHQVSHFKHVQFNILQLYFNKAEEKVL